MSKGEKDRKRLLASTWVQIPLLRGKRLRPTDPDQFQLVPKRDVSRPLLPSASYLIQFLSIVSGSEGPAELMFLPSSVVATSGHSDSHLTFLPRAPMKCRMIRGAHVTIWSVRLFTWEPGRVMPAQLVGGANSAHEKECINSRPLGG